uniref:hypothetical protein n=1 Tax=Alistipes shahii TaxID=328814 RepID=UPI002666B4E6
RQTCPIMQFYCSEQMQNRELNTCKHDIYSFLRFSLPTNTEPMIRSAAFLRQPGGGARFRRRAASLSATCGSRAPGESNAQPEEAKQAEQKRPREQAPAIGKAPSKGGETAPQQTAGRQSGEHPASSAETLC